MNDNILNKIKEYFGGMIVGSYLIVEAGLLEYSDINDVDIIVMSYHEKGITKFLCDNGYIAELKDTYNHKYDISFDIKYEKKNEIPLHIMFVSEKKSKLSLGQIFKNKVEINTVTNYRQMEKIFKRLAEKQWYN